MKNITEIDLNNEIFNDIEYINKIDNIQDKLFHIINQYNKIRKIEEIISNINNNSSIIVDTYYKTYDCLMKKNNELKDNLA